MRLTSPAFNDGDPVPTKFTCNGSDISPPLRWTDAPPGTKSFALICDDSDAPMGTWVHWVIYGLPASTSELPEKIPASEAPSKSARQGINDFKRTGYDGPCPPPGTLHRYFFKLYALDLEPALKPSATKAELQKAIRGHVLAEASLMGTFQRS